MKIQAVKICYLEAHSSFAPFRRYFCTQMVTYSYRLTFSVHLLEVPQALCLELEQNINTLNSYKFPLSIGLQKTCLTLSLPAVAE